MAKLNLKRERKNKRPDKERIGNMEHSENGRPERKRIELSQTSKVKKMKNEINVQYKYNKVGHRMSN